MSRADQVREQMAHAAERRRALKALIGEHPDLRARVEQALAAFGSRGTFATWSGYIPEETIGAGAFERPNPSPVREALVEIADEARRRYAEKMAGELPPC